MTWAGPHGAETTLRYEAFCEGIQYAEAMIAVSEALDKKQESLGRERTRHCGRCSDLGRPAGQVSRPLCRLASQS